MFVALGAVSASFDAVSAQTVEPGFAFSTTALDPNVFYGGFALLPSGHAAVYDGRAVREIDLADGSVVATLLAAAGSPFGSFLEVSPDGRFLYFGESTSGSIHELELSSGTARVVARFSLPYGLAFDPTGRCYVSWSPGFFQGGRVSWLDLETGLHDLVLVTGGASGPMAFDAKGQLHYAVADTNWPPAPDSTPILAFTSQQLRDALGAGHLVETDGRKIGDVDGAFDLAFDESGDLWVSDSVYFQLTEFDAETGVERTIVDGPDFQGITYFAFQPPASGDAFEWFQPAHSGALYGISSDFFSYNELFALTPQRAILETQPPSPIPPGQFDFELSGGVLNGSAWLFVTSGLLPQEERLPNSTWPAPLYFGLDVAGGILYRQRVSLDAFGEWTVQGDSTGLSGLTLGVQALIGPTAAGPFYSTTTPLEIQFQ